MSHSDHTTRRREVFPISEADATFNSERRHNWGGYGGSSGLSAHGNIAAGSHYGGGSGLSSSGSISAGSHYGGGGGLSSSGYISSGSHYGGGGGGSSGGGGGNSGAAAAAAAHAAFVAAATARNNAALNMLGFHTPGQQGGSQFGNLFTGRTAVSKVLGSSTGLKASGSVNPTKAPKITLPPAPKINTSTAASTAVAQAVQPAQIKAVGNLTSAPKVPGLKAGGTASPNITLPKPPPVPGLKAASVIAPIQLPKPAQSPLAVATPVASLLGGGAPKAQPPKAPPIPGLSASATINAAPKLNLPAAKTQRTGELKNLLTASGSVPKPAPYAAAAKEQRLGEFGRLLSTAGGQQARSADTQLNQQQRELGNRASAAINVLNKQKGTGGVNPLTGQKSTPQNNARLLSQLKQILEFSKTHTSSQQLRGVINALKPGVFDEGIDYTRPGNVRAVGPGTIVSVQTGTGWPGGTFIKEKLDKPFEGHQFVYYAENIKPNVKPGQRVNTKQPVGYTPGKYPFIEVGWSVPGGADQAAAHTHYSGQHVGYSQALPEAQSFQRYLQQGGAVPPHLSNAQHAILQQADRLGGGDKQVAALRAQIKGSRNPGATGGGQQGPAGVQQSVKDIFTGAGKATGIPAAVLWSIYGRETAHGTNVTTSSAGAQGPMQFLPSTFAKYGKGGNINSLKDSVYAAARYLKASGGRQNIQKAIFAYNHSSSYVADVMNHLNEWNGGAAAAGASIPSSGGGSSSGVGSAGTGSVGLSGGSSGAASPGRSGSPASAKSTAQQAQDKRQQIALNLASSLIGQQSKGALQTVLAKKGKGGKTPTLAQLLKA